MQSSSHELSSPVADSVYVKYIYVKNPFAYAGIDDSFGVKSGGFRSQLQASSVSSVFAEIDGMSGVKYPAAVKLTGFRSQLEAFRVSSHTE